MSKVKLTPIQFNDIAALLRRRLTEALQKEIEDCALPDLADDEDTDLWTLPNVDSKTVVKLSPTVKELTGWSLDPTWIKKGGYASVEDAVSDLVAQIKAHCVSEKAMAPTSKKIGLAIASHN